MAIKNKKRALSELKLEVIFEITKAINSNSSTDVLLEMFENFLKSNLFVKNIILFSFNKNWDTLINSNKNHTNPKSEINFESYDSEFGLSSIQEAKPKLINRKRKESSYDIIVPVFHKTQALAFLFLKFDYTEKKINKKDLSFIQAFTNIIAVAIENKKLARARLVQELTKKELELASQMQNLLIPSTLPHNEKLEITALYKPYHEVGGDYFDYIELNESEFFICIADVSGKGLSAALLMANFQANLHGLINNKSTLKDIVKELNRRVFLNTKGERFITFFIAKINQKTKTLEYVNAGHPSPLLYQKNLITLLKKGCTGLGMFEIMNKIEQGKIKLESATDILCYTDGIIEIENELGEDFGMNRLKNLLTKQKYECIGDLKEVILHTIENYGRKVNFKDDITILCCRIH